MSQALREHPRVPQLVRGLALAVWLCALAGCGNAQPPQAQAGSIDLRGWNFASQGAVGLNGEWEWYWQKWLAPTPPSLVSADPRTPSSGYYPVPQLWNGMVVNGKTLPGEGYATFRLRVRLPPKSRYALLVRLCSSAYRIFWNERELVATGVLGESRETSIPGCAIRTPTLDAEQEENLLTVQLDNYHHSRGGFRKSLVLGSSEQIASMRERRIVLDAFILGSLSLITLYSLTVFFLRRRDLGLLYLGLFCVSSEMWIGMQGSSILLGLLFPGASWSTLVHLEYLGLYLAPIAFGLLICASYPSEAPRWLFPPFFVTFGGLTLGVLLFPPILFTRLIGFSSGLILFFAISCMGVAMRSAARKRGESLIVTLGFLPLCIAVCIDAFGVMRAQNSAVLTPSALMILVLIHALLLSRRSVQAQVLIEQQTHTLLRLNAAYYRFVPKEFLHLLGKDDILEVQIGDQVQREMTVLFADVRDFTALSERMTPQENFAFVNRLLGRIGPLIREHQGFIDKYLGDGIMALFPTHPADAVRTALEMCRALKNLNAERAGRGEPAVRIGVGIHTGSIMLGTVGEPERMDGTVISDVVNTAARLESLTKLQGVAVIISEQVEAALDSELKASVRILGRVLPKGKAQPLTVYEFFAGDADAGAAQKRATRERFEAALASYQAGDFQTASTSFEALCAQNPKDFAARYYHRRSLELEAQHKLDAKKEWDGVEVILDK